MGIIVIPSDYNEILDGTVVPICIEETDSEGLPISREWIDRGVVPVADQLTRLAERVLRDNWRVSEITELAVHPLWRTHRGNLGEKPSLRVLRRAHHYAEDLRAGGRRARRKSEVELFTA